VIGCDPGLLTTCDLSLAIVAFAYGRHWTEESVVPVGKHGVAKGWQFKPLVTVRELHPER
jgi:hypothetical protein